MKSIFFHLLLPFYIGSPLFGQDSESPEPGKPRGPVAYMVATSIPDDLENPVDVLAGEKITQLTLSKRSASAAVEIPDDRILRIVRPIENPEDPEKPAYVTLARVAIPEGVSNALIILVPVAENADGLIFQTRVLDLATFRGGDYLYLNLCPLDVAVELGEWRSAIRPGEIKIYDAPVLSEPKNVAVRYSFYHQTQKKWKMLSASTIVLRATRREICIFSWDPRFDRVDYHGINFPVTR